MENRWDDTIAKQYESELALRVYTSRLLGADPYLVMHGGGNTSVKIRRPDVFGEPEDVLYVKGSGWDLASIEEPGFAPVKLDHLIKLGQLPALSDTDMVNELKTHMLKASAPTPSVEAILHAVLPYKYVDHTHADAVVTITNTPGGMERIKAIYGDDVVIIPYVMPGFVLAKLVADVFPQQVTAATQGMVLMNHGIFSFGETAKQSYDRMIALVQRAEDYLKEKQAWHITPGPARGEPRPRHDGARLRAELARVMGAPCIVNSLNDDFSYSFAQHEAVGRMSQQGPATPDHIIRTKQIPMLDDDIEAYVNAYKEYFQRQAAGASQSVTMLDPAPRVVLHRKYGMSCVGRTAKDAAIVQDIYRHTMEVIQRAEALGGYQALGEKDLFEVEYWELEQAKLKRGGKPPAFTGEVAVVTGAACGIGKACVESFLNKGAAVVALDVSAAVENLHSSPSYLGLVCDVTDELQIQNVLDRAVQTFGGIDMAVLNAGIFPASTGLDSLTLADWRKVQSVNLDANIVLLRELFPLLQLAPNYGRVVFIGSKNVPAPGPGAAAYSASKAALNQVARVAALEWGHAGIRVNTLHPNAVFDTGVWTQEVLQSRAASYGLSVEDYKKKNVLQVEVSSANVGEMAAALCSTLFEKTTGAQIPVDGGNERVI